MARWDDRFPEDYIEKCFTVWVGADRPTTDRLIKILPENQDGHKPSVTTLQVWKRKYDWYGRADKINAQALEKANEFIITKKSELLIKQFNEALKVSDVAFAHLISGTFDSSSAAVQAFFRGLEEQRKVVGISDMLEKMSKMNDEEIRQEIISRIRRASEAEQVIEGDINSEDTEADSSNV